MPQYESGKQVNLNLNHLTILPQQLPFTTAFYLYVFFKTFYDFYDISLCLLLFSLYLHHSKILYIVSLIFTNFKSNLSLTLYVSCLR